MKRTILPAALLLSLLSCTAELGKDSAVMVDTDGLHVLHAVMEDEALSKVYADADLKLLWNAGDELSVFNKSTYNSHFSFGGNDGDNAGDFNDITPSGLHTGNALDYIYALCPWSETARIDNAGSVINTELPGRQSWARDSFGPGANTMVAVSDNGFLAFKNVCGYINVRLFGEGVSVRKITLRGNGGEKLSGAAALTVSPGAAPLVSMAEDASGRVELVCEPPVELGADRGDAVSFWLAVTPTVFEEGFTITVQAGDGGLFTKTTDKKFTVSRSVLEKMAPLEVLPSYDEVPVEFDDEAFKAYCVSNFDLNGDGEISRSEAAVVKEIIIGSEDDIDIASLGGIEYFTDLEALVIWAPYDGISISGFSEEEISDPDSAVAQHYEQLRDKDFKGLKQFVDLSHNLKLKRLGLSRHRALPGIDISKNVELESLRCYSSMVLDCTLDISNNVNLKTLDCSYSYLHGELDLSACRQLKSVRTSGNCFTNVVIGEKPELTTMSLGTPYGVSLDFTGCPNLTSLYCVNSGVKSIDLSQCSKLTRVDAYCNYLCEEFKLGEHPELTWVYLAQCHRLKSLNLLGCPNLQWISTWSTENLAPVDYSACTRLETLYLPPNGSTIPVIETLTGYTVSEPGDPDEMLTHLTKFPNLKSLGAWHFTELDLSHNTEVESLWIGTNRCVSKTVDLTPLHKLKSLSVDDWSDLEVLDISQCPLLTDVNFKGCEALVTLYVAPGQEIEGITMNRSDEKINPSTKIVTVVPVPDPAFKAYLLEHFDSDGDGILSTAEAETIEAIEFWTDELGVKSLAGIEYMPNLQSLVCQGNWLDNKNLEGIAHYYLSKHLEWPECYGPIGTLEYVDVTHNPRLRMLLLGGNSALGDLDVNLDLSNNHELEEVELGMTWISIPDFSKSWSKIKNLNISHSRGTIPDFSKMPLLERLEASYLDNAMGEGWPIFIDVSNNPHLRELAVNGTANGISDISLNPEIISLSVDYCGLHSIVLSALPKLKYFRGCGNLFSVLNVSQNPELEDLYLTDNGNLTTLYVSAGQKIEGVTVNRSTDRIPEHTQIVER